MNGTDCVKDPPERITKVDTRLQQRSYGAGAVWMSLPFILMGAFFVVAGFFRADLIDDANAPVWIIGFIGLSFAFAGLLLFLAGFRGVLRNRRDSKTRSRYPGQPWRYDYAWQSDGISDDAADRIVRGILMSIFLAVFLVPFVWWAFFSRESHMMVQGLVSLFLAVWAIVLLTMVYRALQYFKYGATRLCFREFPFELGADLAVGFNNQRLETLTATLRFVEEKFVRRGSGRNRTVSHESFQHWAESQQRQAKPGEFVEFSFRLPDNPEYANQLIADPAIRYWELLIEADAPGIDFRTTFPLPVYEGPIHPQPNSRFGRLTRGRALARLPFEFRVVAAPLLLLMIIWFAAPDLLNAAINKTVDMGYRAANLFALRPLPNVSAAAMYLAEDRGTVWALSKYDVTRFPGSDPDDANPLLTSKIYRAQFNDGMDALSSLLVRDNGELWVGSWYGEILVNENGRWRQLMARESTPLSRIHHMVEFQGQVYVASNGLWQWNVDTGALTNLVPGNRLTSVAVANDRIYFGAGNRLGHFDGVRVWQDHEHGAEISTLALAPDGSLVVGSSLGLHRYSPESGLVATLLEDVNVIRVRLLTNGKLAVGTLASGIFIERDSGWFHTDDLPEVHVSDLLLDGAGRLWIATYGAGVCSIEVERLISRPTIRL